MEKFVLLSEVGRFSKLTESDISLHTNPSELEFACYTKSTKSIIGAVVEGRFRGIGVYNYRGWMGVSAKSASNIIDSGKSQVYFGRATANAGVELVSEVYPFQVYYPNNLIAEWGRPSEMSDYPHLRVYPYFIERASNQRLMAQGQEMFFGAMKGLASLRKDFDPEDEHVLKYEADITKSKEDAELTPELILSEIGFTFQRSELGISLASLKKLEAQMFGSPEVEQPIAGKQIQAIEPEQTNTLTFNNDLHEVLYNILIAGGDTSHKGVWRTLENEFAKDEGERPFDKYNILLDVSATELLWVSRAGLNRQTMKFSSLATALSKLKKRIISN
ncbi:MULTISPECIES: hypothetical protein [unclassified Agarivorans]|uniref:hypothetical protein n=1 Tax=unclassified Agarivorans TaxID=2636026 RepID=UPI0026E3285E|nr:MULTISPECIES: hypothetical protein [unclassified Agarivorans]MDO6686732.1 hypothetical protein [Agarivorans sp. 3_MG-2023]MDO6716538.1 hypothetical protein [Agarivorans sp. 2_MG-2023]